MKDSESYINTIVLAGGKGERLRPLTHDVPKPMISLKGQPIIWYVLKQLENYNTGKIYLTVGYKSNVIKNYIESHFSHLNIAVVDDGDVDIIERIKSVISLSKDKSILVLYGDTISNVNIDRLVFFNRSNINFGTMTIWPLLIDFGVIEINENQEVISFVEKPKLDKWINIGYFIFKPQIFPYLLMHTTYVDFLLYCVKHNHLNAYIHKGEHYTINTLLELEVVKQNINKIIKF